MDPHPGSARPSTGFLQPPAGATATLKPAPRGLEDKGPSPRPVEEEVSLPALSSMALHPGQGL